MRSTIIILIIFISSNFYVKAQTEDSIPQINYDSVTYDNYLKANWDGLIVNTKEAIDNGFETFAIRKRLAYACFMKEDYLTSARQYHKIYKNNPLDVDARLMLYHNYLNTANYQRAKYYAAMFTDEERLYYLVPKNTFITSIDLGGGYQTSDNYSLNANNNIINNKVYGQQILNRDLSFAQLGLTFQANSALHITLGCDVINTNREEKIVANNYSLLGTRYDTSYIIDNKISQQQFYIQTAFVLPRMYSLKLFGNFIFNQYTNVTPSYKVDSLKDPKVDTFMTERTNYTFNSTTSNNLNYVVGATIEKEIRKLKLGLTACYSKLSGNNQIQGDFYTTWYPKGNTNLSFNAQLTVLSQNSEMKYIPSFESTFRAAKKLWVSAHVLYGDLTNTSEMNGQLVNNITDKTIFRMGTSVYYTMSKNLILHLTYRYSLRQSNYVIYSDAFNYSTTYNNYNNYLIALGLKFNL
ncbi:MAG: hypothetical protein NTU43_01880 [Bacteroidetes bacterium]|nr:hypothetical protein [Bacteroidota bacterium]